MKKQHIKNFAQFINEAKEKFDVIQHTASGHFDPDAGIKLIMYTFVYLF